MTGFILDNVPTARGDLGPVDVGLPVTTDQRLLEDTHQENPPWKAIRNLVAYAARQKLKFTEVFRNVKRSFRRNKKVDAHLIKPPGNSLNLAEEDAYGDNRQVLATQGSRDETSLTNDFIPTIKNTTIPTPAIATPPPPSEMNATHDNQQAAVSMNMTKGKEKLTDITFPETDEDDDGDSRRYSYVQRPDNLWFCTAPVEMRHPIDDTYLGPQTILFDTGAPSNFISSALVKETGVTPKPLMLHDLHSYTGIGMQGPDGNEAVTPTKYVSLKLTCRQHKLHNVKESFLVIENLGYPLICGRPSINEHNIEMSPSQARQAYPVTERKPSPGKSLYSPTATPTLTPVIAAIARQKEILRQSEEEAKLAAKIEAYSSGEITKTQTSQSGELAPSSRTSTFTSTKSGHSKKYGRSDVVSWPHIHTGVKT
jgi:hypothetical protein